MKHWIIGSVAAAALLTACGGNKGTDDAIVETSDVSVGDVKLPGLSLRTGDAGQAGDALTALSLADSGAGRVSFDNKSTDGADATFETVTITAGDGAPVKAGSLVFKGLEMTDVGASFAQMSLNDITIDVDSEDEDAPETVMIGSVKLSNPSPELAAWVSTLMADGEPGEFPAFENLSFDGLDLSGLSIQSSDTDSSATIDAFELRNMTPDNLGALVLSGINMNIAEDDETGHFKLGSMTVTGVRETVIKPLGLLIESGGDEAAAEALAGELMSLVSNNPGDPGYDQLNVDALSFDMAGVTFDMPSLNANVARDGQGRATRSVTQPFTMTLNADPEGEFGSQLAGPLALMGFETLNFSGASDVRMDPDDDTMSSSASDNYLALEDGFKLSFGGNVSGLSAYYAALAEAVESGVSEDEAMLAGVSALALQDLEIAFEDNSIVDKGFTTAAAMFGEDAASLRAQVTAGVATLPLFASQAGVDPALANELSGALSTFLSESGTLRIKLSPESPVTAADFEDTTQLTKDRLGFSATAQ